MPKASFPNALVRQWELLKKLPSRSPGLTAADLTQSLRADGFSATKRTVERDLALLERLFSIRCNDTSAPYGWHWIKSSVADLPSVDCADALSLTLVEALLGQLAPVSLLRVLEPKFAQARAKLGSIPEHRYAQWSQRVRYVPSSFPFLPPKILPGVLEIVQEAIVQQRQLQIRYSSPTDARTRALTLHPLAFIQHGPVAYLVATAFDFTDPRLYALHRVNAARLSTNVATTPADFSLDAFLADGGMQFGEGGPLQLQAVVSGKLACYLTECPLSQDQRLTAQRADRYLLTATLKDSWQLYFWILSQGEEIVVVQPAHLRKRIRESLQAALKNYVRS